jgi:multicomponent K+:H+ antiporter subunit G
MQFALELLVAFFVLVGASFTLIGSIGLARLPDFYSRLHGPTKATTLGVGGTLVGSAIFFTARAGAPSFHEVLVTVFLFMTAPVSAHLMCKAAIHMHVPNVSGAPDERRRDSLGTTAVDEAGDRP